MNCARGTTCGWRGKLHECAHMMLCSLASHQTVTDSIVSEMVRLQCLQEHEMP